MQPVEECAVRLVLEHEDALVFAHAVAQQGHQAAVAGGAGQHGYQLAEGSLREACRRISYNEMG